MNHCDPVTVEQVVGVCREVFSELGVGHSERVYHQGVIVVLNKREIFHRSEVATPIYMRSEVVGFGRADLVVGRIAVELKAVSRQPTRVSGQLCKYVKSLNADKLNEFNSRCVKSSFFSHDGSGASAGGCITDVEYADQYSEMVDNLYIGAVINFNQRTGTVDLLLVTVPQLGDLGGQGFSVDEVPRRCQGVVADAPAPVGNNADARFAVTEYLKQYVGDPSSSVYVRGHVWTVGASQLYGGFLSSRIGVGGGISHCVFGRIVGEIAGCPGSGITKSRASCSGYKYTVNPLMLQRYLGAVPGGGGGGVLEGALAENQPGASSDAPEPVAEAETSLCLAVDAFFRSCVEPTEDRPPRGLSLYSLVLGFQAFTGSEIVSIRSFKVALGKHLREVRNPGDNTLMYLPLLGDHGIRIID